MTEELRAALAALTQACEQESLRRDAQTLSERYRLHTGTGRRLLTGEREAAAYAAARMPATFEAIRAALAWSLDCAGLAPRTLLDCGAGTGSACWAADSLLRLEQVTCLEREAAMRAVGRWLMASGSAALAGAQWCDTDLTADAPLPRAELVIEGYMLGELACEARIPAARRLFDAAQQLALFVEPGTPQGFENLRAVREALTAQGAQVAAPCPGGRGTCPMEAGDWCHFAVRVQRTRLHRSLKGGEAPFEDEKFAYLALMRGCPAQPCAARVLRHPQIAPGRITLTLCGAEGRLQRAVTKKDPLWKRARKLGTGDAWPPAQE